MTITISKSKFGVQCLKRLYLLEHAPEVARGINAAGFARLERGRQVGKPAHKLFPGGVEIRTGDRKEAIRATRELIDNPAISAIFEAAFEHGGVFVRVDILQRRRDGKWRLIEVKSTAEMKDHHLDDVAIQYRVARRSGLDVASCAIAHPKPDCIFPGASVDARRSFRIRNLTRNVEGLQPKLTFPSRSELRILARPTPPDISPGSHCSNPVRCEFFEGCNRATPHRLDEASASI